MAGGSKKGVYAAALALFLGGLGWLVYSGLDEGSVYFLNVSEALAMKPEQLGQARLFGTVAEQGVEPAVGGLGVRFTLVDKDDPAKTIPVDYKGAVPDTFKPGVEVIVEGGVKSPGGVFGASTLMTKCPSKYQKENRKESKG
ncbi:Cytochrome c-type biogenesis protein CcmE [Fundidesulfovibrio magnetotacticus]|uniref:Cytochrome c-type biogenesis protein CcmE n=1 Tax=Fundidesulfovibrio magnetotacticus TaxID=2730080 RepID=A0A6V8LWV0_9BACT|nr:cytochrome c maturation protein CcmE [Fundidesulfovibrio magnetotacticus]GFK94276.1 Cytochrome c-type biogenesis protein CcmE [Fundidesulfovibrio magnetotacticus]